MINEMEKENIHLEIMIRIMDSIKMIIDTAMEF